MRKICRLSKKAVGSMISAVLMFLIVIAAMTSLIAFFASTNLSQEKQANFERAQAQEQITITTIGVDSTQKITNITVLNSGTVDVLIRAIYRTANNVTALLCDPSTPIASGFSQTINLTSYELPAQANDIYIASTERGTKSKAINEVELNYRDYNDYTNTSALTIGPLLLTFDSLNWAPVDATGNMVGDWTQTWVIPTGNCTWRLKLTNVDTEHRNITVGRYSGFSLSRVGSPSTTTWYLKDIQQTVNFNQSCSIIYLWNSARTLPVSAGENQKGTNNVFLTFFGNYSDGSSLAQTIPFEAIIVT